MSSVNDQITDSVSQINALLTGGAPSQSMGMLDVTSTETMGMSMFNAVTAQQNSQTAAGAALTASCAKMLRTESIPEPHKTKETLQIELLNMQLEEEKLVNQLTVEVLQQINPKASLNQQTLLTTLNTVSEKEKEKVKDQPAKLIMLESALAVVKKEIMSIKTN